MDFKRHELGLGPLYSISLAEARDRARAFRLQLIDGIDPLEAKRAAKRERLAKQAATVTFRQCVEMYLAAKGGNWTNPKHAAQWRATLEFLILRAARRNELLGATWGEINFKTKTWVVPASRMKARKEHRVPLSDRALEILAGRPQHGENIFGLGADKLRRLLSRLRPG